MVNNTEFSKRLKTVMEYYQLSPASLADSINVQRSSISHLLSGRNKPSLDFVLKILEKYKEVELYWLLNGKGVFPKEEKKATPIPLVSSEPSNTDVSVATKEIERIIVFFKDGSFKNYTE